MWLRAEPWDQEEREALAALEADFAYLRRRHENDLPVEMLKAARAGMLDDHLQFGARRYLSKSRWSQALLAGLDDASVSLTPKARARLLKRINSAARFSAGPAKAGRHEWAVVSGFSRTSKWLWPALATAAVAVIVTVVTVSREGPDTPRSATVAVDTNLKNETAYRLALEKPDVKLSIGSLTWRGSSAKADLVGDLKSGLDAFRRDDFATARRELGALTSKYPNAIEVFLYLGVSQVYLGEYQAALDNLRTAVGLSDTADTWFGVEAVWQRAIAEERLGRTDDARLTLTVLCRSNSPRAQAACAGAASLK